MRFQMSMVVMLCSIACSHTVSAEKPLVYFNENFGFNVPGYAYQQAELPCNIDTYLVKQTIKRAKKKGLRMEAVSSHEKITNGQIPVLAVDIEELVLGETQYGVSSRNELPKVKVTVAFVQGDKMQTETHRCAIASLNELTSSSDIMDMGTVQTICSATRKCLRRLSKDIVQWTLPQLK